MLCSISKYLCSGWLQHDTRILLIDFLEVFILRSDNDGALVAGGYADVMGLLVCVLFFTCELYRVSLSWAVCPL